MIPFLLLLFIFGSPSWGFTESMKSAYIDVNRETTMKKEENKSFLQKKKSSAKKPAKWSEKPQKGIDPTTSFREHEFSMDQGRPLFNFTKIFEKKRAPLTDSLEKLIFSHSLGHWGWKDMAFMGVAEAKTFNPETHLSNGKLHLKGEEVKERKLPEILKHLQPKKELLSKEIFMGFSFSLNTTNGHLFLEIHLTPPFETDTGILIPF